MKTKTLLACGVIGGPLFVATFLLEGATRANYDPLRHPVSSLALGDSGWMQTAKGLRRRPAARRFGRGGARPGDRYRSGCGQ